MNSTDTTIEFFNKEIAEIRDAYQENHQQLNIWLRRLNWAKKEYKIFGGENNPNRTGKFSKGNLKENLDRAKGQVKHLKAMDTILRTAVSTTDNLKRRYEQKINTQKRFEQEVTA
tara:strand:+ start:11761 stop:12105 length:345 start_codon:yes stop_codon:yes gene_type:complete